MWSWICLVDDFLRIRLPFDSSPRFTIWDHIFASLFPSIEHYANPSFVGCVGFLGLILDEQFRSLRFRFNSVAVENGSRYFNIEAFLKLKPWEVQNQTKSGL